MSNDLMTRLNNHSDIRSKDCGNGITSYNFTRRAFQKNLWDETTVNARGLFMRGDKIVGRGYNKFFNLNQEPGYTTEDLYNLFTFPIKVMRKYNGFLGIAFVDEGEIHFFTKGGGSNNYSEEGMRLLKETVNSDNGLRTLRDFLETENKSLTFEVISDKDKHIVDEGRERVVPLHLIDNTEESNFVPVGDNAHADFFRSLGFEVPDIMLLRSARDLDNFLDCAFNAQFEGYVMEDNEGRMTKIKSDAYLKVKSARGGLLRILRGEEPRKVSDTLQFLMNSGIANGIKHYTYTNLLGVEDVDLPRLALEYGLMHRFERPM